MNPTDLATLAKRLAAELGFEACGITDPSPSAHGDALDRWLVSGYDGDMRYMARQAAARRNPGIVWTDCRSVVVVLHNYYCPGALAGAEYRIARYAQGNDYHDVMASLLGQLGGGIVAAAGSGSCRVYVDSGPLPERELGNRAGLGWMAKNTMLIHPRLGSFTFIGCLLTDLEIRKDEPFGADRCGSCTRCLEACPTGAFVAPRVLDATRCISYLTIEARHDVPEQLRRQVGDHLFGCDVCQEVCPWNHRFAREAAESRYRPRSADRWPSLDEILELDQQGFDDTFGHTALERARLAGLQRNARVVRENAGR